MASNLSVTIGANVANLQAQLAVGEAALKKLANEANRTARSLANSFDPAKAAQLPQIYQNIAAQQQKNAQTAQQLTAATTSLTQSFTQSHGAAAQLSFQINDLFTQIASGTSVQQALIQQGGQIVQIFQMSSGAAAVFSQALQAILSPTGLIVTGLAAAAGAAAYFGYQIYQTRQNINQMQGDLVATGRVSGGGFEQISKDVDDLANKFDLSRKAASELLKTVAEARTLGPSTVAPSRVASLVAGFGRMQREAGIDTTDVKIAKDWAKALDEGAAGIIKLSQNYNIAQSAAEQMLKSGDVRGAFLEAWKTFEEGIRNQGAAWGEAKAKAEQYKETITNVAAALGEAGGIAMGAFQQNYPAPPKPTDKPSGGTGLEGGAGQMRSWLESHGYTPQATAAIMGNAKIESSFNPASWSPDRKYFGLFQWDATRRAALGNPPSTDFNRQMELMDKELSQRLPGFRTSTETVATLAGRFDKVFEVSDPRHRGERIAAAEGYAGGTTGQPPEFDKAERERQQRQNEETYRRNEVTHRHSLETQLADAQKHYNEVVKLVIAENKDITTEELLKDQRVVAAAQDVATKRAALTDQQTQIELTGIKEREAASVDISKKIEAAEAAIAAARKRGEAPGGGGVNPQEIQQLEQQRDALRRELYKQENDLAVARVQERIAAEKDPLKRVPLYKEIEEIRRTGGANIPHTAQALAPTGIDPVAAQQAAGQVAAAERQARQETLAAKQEEVSRMRQMGQAELQEFTAQQQLLVARHQITQEQALANEAAATDAWLAKQRQRLVALLAEAEALGASAREIEKFKDAITQIDLERKTKQAEFQTKEAEAQERRLQKLSEPIKQAFTSIENSIESAVTGLLTGKTTWQKAMEQVKDSIIGGLVKSVFGSLSKGLASAMGAKEGEGLGEFLGNKIGKSLFSGLTSGMGGTAEGGGGGLFGGGGIFSFLLAPFHLFGFQHGGIIPAAAGGWALPSSFGSDRVLSALSPGEMVLPRQISQGLQTAIGGGGFGGGDTHQYSINVNAIDARSGAQFLMSHSDTIAASLGRSRRNFNQAGR